LASPFAPTVNRRGYPTRRNPQPQLGERSGSDLRTLRLSAGLSVRELASELGFTPVWIYNLERRDAVAPWIFLRHAQAIGNAVAKRKPR
jgi:hypothetical protein